MNEWIAIITLGAAVVCNFGAAIWWTSKLDSRVCILEEWRHKTSPVLEWIVKMETQMTIQQKALDRIETSLEELRRTVDRHVGEIGV